MSAAEKYYHAPGAAKNSSLVDGTVSKNAVG